LSDSKSGSANPPSSTPPPATPPAAGAAAVKSTAQVNIDHALAELEETKRELKVATDTIADLTTQLKAANDVLEGQAKAKLIGEILPRSKFTVEDLSEKNLEELEHIKLTLDQAKLPTYKNIHFGPISADEQGDKGLTAHRDLRPLADQRKTGRA
jgi:membrane-bound lytic murein transglycosylase B